MDKMEIFRDDALYAIEEITKGLKGGNLSLRDREDLLHALSDSYRVAGIAALLTEADVAEFQRCLAHSGQARLQVLALAPHQPPERFRCASHLGPFFDALASGTKGLALEIARQSPAQWAGDEEWEEDFRYARFLHALLIAGNSPTSEVGAALAAFQRADDAGAQRPSSRRKLAEALVTRHQESFDDALEELLQEHQQEAQERKERGPLLNPARHHTGKAIFIEGVALLGIAEACSLRTRREYPGIPGIARS